MATTLSVNAGYTGALAGDIFVQAFKKSDTIAKGAITVLPNNIGTGYLPKLSYSAELIPYSCGFEGNGTVDYTDKEVTLKKFKIEDQLCKDEFHQSFQAQASGLFSANNEIPQTIQEAILEAMVKNAGAKVDYAIWQGVSGSLTGLLAQFSADATVIDVSGSAVTATNAIAEIGKVYTAVPAEIEDEDDLVIVVSRNVGKAYKQAQAALTSVGTPVGDKELDYLGTKIITVGGLPTNTMLAYRVKNVGFLTGLESDLNDVRVIDTDATLGDGNVRTKMVFEMGVGYSFGAEIVYYRVI
jgi:hypothetical protein